MSKKNEALRILHKYLIKAEKRVDDLKDSIALLEGGIRIEVKKYEIPPANNPQFLTQAKKFVDNIEVIKTGPLEVTFKEPLTTTEQIIAPPFTEKTQQVAMDSVMLLQNLRKLRLDNGQSQNVIAELCGVHFSAVSLWEKGNWPKNNHGVIASKLAKHFNINLTAVIEGATGEKRTYNKRGKEPKSDPEDV